MVKLVPYNDAMRLGQGFNSYTQQICIDDAVIVDPTRAENVLTNNGTTMRILAQKTNKASVWRQMKEYVIDGKETTVSTEPKNLIDKPEEEQDKENLNQDSTTAVEEKKKKKLGALNSVKIYENRQKEIAKKIASNANTEDVDTEDDAKAIKSAEIKEAAPKTKPVDEVEEPEDENLKLDTQIQESEAKKAETKKKMEENNKQFRKGILEEGKDISLNTFKSSEQQLKEANEERDKKIDQGRISLGIGKDLEKLEAWPIENAIGTSQTVTYISHFVDKVSEINNDMRLSAALSIKAGKFGGSGRGSFFTSEEFNESDLRFYISVKVTNQSINFKDALQYNPVPGLNPQEADEFTKIFGDSFISGFVEGGEFNALVLMKIKNEAKLQDIKAEVKVAFTTADKKEEEKKEGGDKTNKEFEKSTEVDKKPEENKAVESGKKTEEKAGEGKGKDKKGIKIDAEGNLKLAKRNIAMNAETTIYVSWTGGAAIKPYDEKWTIESLMAAAQRFPALVALYPQRIYAQVTEYRHLRSFVKLKPQTLLPITYQNASMYTNTLLDVYMEYKTLFKKISMDILDIQSGKKVFKEELRVETEEQKIKREKKERGELSTDEEEKEEEAIDPSLVIRKVQLSKALITAGLTTAFLPTIEGLGEARQAIRKQMNAIVQEVDDITENLSLSLKESDSNWAGPASFQSLIPKIEFKVRKVRGTPLSNKSLDESKEANPNSDQDAFVVHLFDEENSPLSLSETEQLELSEIEQNSPSLADKTRVTAPVGSITAGESFNGLEHNLPEPVISHVSVWQKDGVFCCMAVHYDIGLTVEYGGSIQDHLTKHATSTFKRFDLKELGLSEMITSASIEVEGGLSIDFVHDQNNHDHNKSTEENVDKNKLRVIGIAFSTNRGQKIQALCQRSDQRKNEFTDKYKIHQFEKPLKDTYISGFWGRQSEGAIHRLGLIWTQAPPRTNLFDEEIPMECVTGSLKGSENVEFERTLEDIPSMAYGIRAFGRGTGIEPVMAKTEEPKEIEEKTEEPKEIEDVGDSVLNKKDKVNLNIRTNLDKEKITREGFKYIQDGISKTVDWMVLPELDGTFIQTGQVLFNNSIEDEECLGSSKQSQTVEFKLPFSDKDKIKTVCWLIDFETNRPDDKNENSQTEFHIKVNTVGDITTKMMTIQVGDPQTFIVKKVKGSQSSTQEITPSNEIPLHKFWSARIGWLAYESDGDENEFSHGEMTSPFGIDQNRIVWDTTWSGNSKFSTEPSQTFIALSEIKGKRDYSSYQVDPKTHYSVSLKDVTKDTISLIAEAPQNTSLGAVWISCL